MAYNGMRESNLSLGSGQSTVAGSGVEPNPERETRTYISRRGEPVNIQNPYTPASDGSRFRVIRCIKDFFISCIETIAFLCCCRQRDEVEPPLPLPDPVIENNSDIPSVPIVPSVPSVPSTPPGTFGTSLDASSDEGESVDFHTLYPKLLRENSALERVERKFQHRGLRHFHLVDDIWNFDLEQRLNTYNTNFSYWTMLDPTIMDESSVTDNDFAEIVRFSELMDVHNMAVVLHSIRRKCPETYQLDRYICAIIDYMKQKYEWVQNRQIVRFREGWSGIHKIIVSSELDERTHKQRQDETASFKDEVIDILNNLIAASNDCVDQIGDTVEELLAEYACQNIRSADSHDLAGYSRRWLGLRIFKWKLTEIERIIDQFAKTGRLNKDGGPARPGSIVSSDRNRLLTEKVEVKRIILHRLSLPEERGKYGIVASALTTPRMAENFLRHMPAQLVPAVKQAITQENAISHIINLMVSHHTRARYKGASSLCISWEESIDQELQIQNVVYSSDTPSGNNVPVKNLLNTFLAKVGDLHFDQPTPLGVLYILSKFGCIHTV